MPLLPRREEELIVIGPRQLPTAFDGERQAHFALHHCAKRCKGEPGIKRLESFISALGILYLLSIRYFHGKRAQELLLIGCRLKTVRKNEDAAHF